MNSVFKTGPDSATPRCTTETSSRQNINDNDRTRMGTSRCILSITTLFDVECKGTAKSTVVGFRIYSTNSEIDNPFHSIGHIPESIKSPNLLPRPFTSQYVENRELLLLKFADNFPLKDKSIAEYAGTQPGKLVP